MEIKILGSGCTRCEALERVTRKALEELHLDATIEKIGDIEEILAYGILTTPGLVINEKVILSGWVPKMTELKSLLIANVQGHAEDM